MTRVQSQVSPFLISTSSSLRTEVNDRPEWSPAQQRFCPSSATGGWKLDFGSSGLLKSIMTDEATTDGGKTDNRLCQVNFSSGVIKVLSFYLKFCSKTDLIALSVRMFVCIYACSVISVCSIHFTTGLHYEIWLTWCQDEGGASREESKVHYLYVAMVIHRPTWPETWIDTDAKDYPIMMSKTWIIATPTLGCPAETDQYH